MCFSASASFTAAFLLSTIGIFTLYKFHSKRFIYFASIPLIFGIQQFFEGILWLTCQNQNYVMLQTIALYIFLITACAVWPIWIPLSLEFLEPKKNHTRKRFFSSLIVLGLFLALDLLWGLFSQGASVKILNGHILYEVPFIQSLDYMNLVFYLLATIAPFFISSIKSMKIMGILGLLSYTITHYFWYEYSISVWCFFAALLSIFVFTILQNVQDRD